MTSRVAVVVPALNEECSIGGVVQALRALDVEPEVVVIDDGSLDGTGQAAQAAGATVLRMPFNAGIGAAVQAGIRFALERGAETIVRVDGDGQHDVADVPSLLEALSQEGVQLVLGSRYLEPRGRQTSPARRAGIAWFAFLLRWTCGLRITDPTSGFWAARADAAHLLLDRYSSDYPEVDSLVYLSRRGCRIQEVPVTMRPRGGGSSSIQGLQTLYYMIKVTLALFMQRVARR